MIKATKKQGKRLGVKQEPDTIIHQTTASFNGIFHADSSTALFSDHDLPADEFTDHQSDCGVQTLRRSTRTTRGVKPVKLRDPDSQVNIIRLSIL